MQTASLHRNPAVALAIDEDASRADWYGLIGTLFQQPPGSALLARIAAAGSQGVADDPGAGGELAHAFSTLSRACEAASEDAVRQEYDSVFLGVGKPEVFLSASYYLTGFLHERPLADLREEMAKLGLSRRADFSQTEDHVGVLCEVMRFLILEGGSVGADLAVQREFFSRFIGGWCDAMCDALEQGGSTDFYKHVGRLARAFFAVERQAFDFDS